MQKKQTDWPVENIERRKIRDLQNNPANARTHSHKQIEMIAAAIDRYGWTTPLLIDENNVLIAGHGRIEAARLLGLEDVAVMVARGWTEEQKRAYVIFDNQIALKSGWDEDILADEIAALDEAGITFRDLGFDDDDINDLLGELPDELEEGNSGRDNILDHAADVDMRIGPYRIKVTRQKMEDWLPMIRAEGGDQREDIKRRILERLGFDY
jgi:ParB-like chromosome segregation protein Spo0J